MKITICFSEWDSKLFVFRFIETDMVCQTCSRQLLEATRRWVEYSQSKNEQDWNKQTLWLDMYMSVFKSSKQYRSIPNICQIVFLLSIHAWIFCNHNHKDLIFIVSILNFFNFINLNSSWQFLLSTLDKVEHG